MPELPEVETTRRGIAPACLNQQVTDVIIRQRKLRWPIPNTLEAELADQTVHAIHRRAKYLLLETKNGTLMIHLGMSGSLRVLNLETAPQPEKHDHVDIHLRNGKLLRFRDPRRFGAFLWTTEPPENHPLLSSLGIEPVGELAPKTTDKIADHLYSIAQRRKISVKALIMDQKIITGVGNIYACESLFHAGIHPTRICSRISKTRYQKLAHAICDVLERAIEQGGTTLQDFQDSEGKPGYFQQKLFVYGRTDEPCLVCGTTLKQIAQNQRSTWYCPHCQK